MSWSPRVPSQTGQLSCTAAGTPGGMSRINKVGRDCKAAGFLLLGEYWGFWSCRSLGATSIAQRFAGKRL